MQCGARQQNRPDLVYATFSKERAAAYRAAVGKFEREPHCRVQFQVVSERVLQGRLESALQAGAAVADVVELLGGSLVASTIGSFRVFELPYAMLQITQSAYGPK